VTFLGSHYFKGGEKCKKGKRLTITDKLFTKIDQQDDFAN